MSSDKFVFWATALFLGWGLCHDDDCISEIPAEFRCDWTCMLLTLQWPGSFCMSLSNKTICEIPPTVNDWTIHGLWPLHLGNCCRCWHMFHSQLQEIESDLKELWPSLVKKLDNFHFWQQEWIKHGTCAGCEETFGSPLLYFQAAVKLRKLFDIDSILGSSGIKASCEVSYKHEEIHQALSPLLGDNYDLQCLTDSKGREAWIQLKIHISRDQTLGCPKQLGDLKFGWLPSLAHPCPKNESIFLVPINYENPHEPCP